MRNVDSRSRVSETGLPTADVRYGGQAAAHRALLDMASVEP